MHIIYNYIYYFKQKTSMIIFAKIANSTTEDNTKTICGYFIILKLMIQILQSLILAIKGGGFYYINLIWIIVCIRLFAMNKLTIAIWLIRIFYFLVYCLLIWEYYVQSEFNIMKQQHEYKFNASVVVELIMIDIPFTSYLITNSVKEAIVNHIAIMGISIPIWYNDSCLSLKSHRISESTLIIKLIGYSIQSIIMLMMLTESRRQAMSELKDNENKIKLLEADIMKLKFELKQSVESKDNFILSISHQLKNPLNNILGNIELIITSNPSEYHDQSYKIMLKSINSKSDNTLYSNMIFDVIGALDPDIDHLKDNKDYQQQQQQQLQYTQQHYHQQQYSQKKKYFQSECIENYLIESKVTKLSSLSENEMRQKLKTCLISGEILLHSINNLLDVNKLESNGIEISPVPVNTRQFFYKIWKISQMWLQLKHLKSGIYVSKNLPNRLNFDAEKLKQILFNLIENATKFTEKGYVKIIIIWIPGSQILEHQLKPTFTKENNISQIYLNTNEMTNNVNYNNKPNELLINDQFNQKLDSQMIIKARQSSHIMISDELSVKNSKIFVNTNENIGNEFNRTTFFGISPLTQKSIMGRNSKDSNIVDELKLNHQPTGNFGLLKSDIINKSMSIDSNIFTNVEEGKILNDYGLRIFQPKSFKVNSMPESINHNKREEEQSISKTDHIEANPLDYCIVNENIFRKKEPKMRMSLKNIDLPAFNESVDISRIIFPKIQPIPESFNPDSSFIGESSNPIKENHGYLKIEVVDSGCGMDDSAISQVFMKYNQRGGDNQQKRLGTGLGLWLSKELCKRMGGDLSVFSKKGHGTTFVFHMKCEVLKSERFSMLNVSDDHQIQSNLPSSNIELLKMPFSSSESPIIQYDSLRQNKIKNEYIEKKDMILVESENKSASHFGNKPNQVNQSNHSEKREKALADVNHPNKILKAMVVDDNKANQEVLKGFLKKCGVQVTDLAADGIEAIETYERRDKNHFDMIFMDIEMPRMDGKKASMTIREFEKEQGWNQVKLIIVTGNCSKTEYDFCLDKDGPIKASYVFSKPFTFMQCKTLVDKFMKEKAERKKKLGMNHAGVNKRGLKNENQGLLKKIKSLKLKNDNINKYVILIDSDYFRSNALSDFLSANHVTCKVLNNQTEALTAIEDDYKFIEAIFINCEIPNINGLDIIQKIYEIMGLKNNGSWSIRSILRDNINIFKIYVMCEQCDINTYKGISIVDKIFIKPLKFAEVLNEIKLIK